MSKETQSTNVIYKLKYPIEWAGSEGVKKIVTEVSFRRPKGKDIKGIGKDVNLEKLMIIASKVSDYSPRFFDEIDGLDCIKVSEVIGGFLDDGQETGRTS